MSLLLYAILRLLSSGLSISFSTQPKQLAMDRQEDDIVIRGESVSDAIEEEEVDLSLRDSRSTVQLPQQGIPSGETTTMASSTEIMNLEAMMSLIMDEVRTLKLQLGGQSLPTVESTVKPELEDPDTSARLEEEDLDNASAVSSKLDGIQPVDHGRWRALKNTEMARSTFSQSLKELDIAKNEDNWARWDSIFHTLVESLELERYVIGEPLPHPSSLEDLLWKFAGGDSSFFAEYVLPRVHQDLFGIVYVELEDHKGVEIVHEEEKRRFDVALVLLFSIITSCTSSARLEGIMDRDGARESRNVSLMYKHLRCHFGQRTGASIAQKMLRLASIAKYNPEDFGNVKAIQILRDSRRALAEQKMGCPDIFFIGLFPCTLEPNSTIKECLQIMVSDALKTCFHPHASFH